MTTTTQRLHDAIRDLAELPSDDALMSDAITASVATLNAGVMQSTRHCWDVELRRKHHARLSAALLAMSEFLRKEAEGE